MLSKASIHDVKNEANICETTSIKDSGEAYQNIEKTTKTNAVKSEKNNNMNKCM